MKQRHWQHSIISTAVCAVVTGLAAGTAAASGFALIEQSGSGLGNAYAGGAAAAEDASTIFFNPAGLTRIQGRQMAVAAHAIKPSAKFSNAGSTTAAATAQPGGNGGDAGDWSLVPNFYYAMDINPKLKFGFGLHVPFGLKTEYDNGWVGRYHALKSEVQTINLNPTIAYQVNDTVSLGLGLSAQRAEAELTKAIDFSSICLGLFGAGCAGLGLSTPGNVAMDGAVKIKGDDWGYGFNLGALFNINPSTRIGVAYRSNIKHELSGNANYSNVPGAFAASPTFTNTSVKASVNLPETVSVSAFHQLNPKWALMGDVTWTRWSRFNELRIRFDNGAADNVTPENWKNTYRVSFGATQRYNDQWQSRIGVAYDQTPVKDEFRTPRIPDQSRTWLALGATYNFSSKSALDFGYAYLSFKDPSINDNEAGAGRLKGNYESNVNILSVQYTRSF